MIATVRRDIMHLAFKTWVVLGVVLLTSSSSFAEEKTGRGAPDVNLPSTQEPKPGEVKDPPDNSKNDRSTPPEKKED